MEITLISGTLLKALALAIMIYFAKKWNHGELKTPIKTLKKYRNEYGIITALFLVAWWLVTPTGTPDDVITLWLIGTIGLIPAIIIIAALTLYLVWRLRTSIALFKRK